MALKGTLKVFGIADILQLIGQQGRRQLHSETSAPGGARPLPRWRHRSRRVEHPQQKDLIGTILVAAENPSPRRAASKRRSEHADVRCSASATCSSASGDRRRRVSSRWCSCRPPRRSTSFFTWKSRQLRLRADRGRVRRRSRPCSRQIVLMEGFRMVDEWPVVKLRITSYEMTFERLKKLPAPPRRTTSSPRSMMPSKRRKKSQGRSLVGFGEQERPGEPWLATRAAPFASS